MKALIIGGGIGGLAAAIALRRMEIGVEVYERSPGLQEAGVGLSLSANAIRVLDLLGLADPIRAHSLSGPQGGLRDWKGAVLLPVSRKEWIERLGALVVLDRMALLSILAHEVPSSLAHLGCECTGFEQTPEGVTARFKNGESARGDVLIGADGLRSAIRGQLLGESPPRYAGYTAWRAVTTPRSDLVITAETWGPGRRFGIVPMRDGRVYWYATKNAREGEGDQGVQGLEGGRKRALLDLFRGWHEPIESLIQATDESSILRNDIYDRDPVPRWIERRVALLGDAAHPMTPNFGQGACQAIEDAAMLAVCLKTSDSIESGLRQYQARRLPRANAIVLQSRGAGEVGQWERPLSFIRNAAFRLAPKEIVARQVEQITRYELLTSRERSLFQ